MNTLSYLKQLVFERQRRSSIQPRVAELASATLGQPTNKALNPERVAARPGEFCSADTTPSGLMEFFFCTQGSAGGATLGWTIRTPLAFPKGTR
jgi:hypothetical protein